MKTPASVADIGLARWWHRAARWLLGVIGAAAIAPSGRHRHQRPVGQYESITPVSALARYLRGPGATGRPRHSWRSP
jgi:hypothetical protein